MLRSQNPELTGRQETLGAEHKQCCMLHLVNSGKMANLVARGLMELKKGERIRIAN